MNVGMSVAVEMELRENECSGESDEADKRSGVPRPLEVPPGRRLYDTGSPHSELAVPSEQLSCLGQRQPLLWRPRCCGPQSSVERLRSGTCNHSAHALDVVGRKAHDCASMLMRPSRRQPSII